MSCFLFSRLILFSVESGVQINFYTSKVQDLFIKVIEERYSAIFDGASSPLIHLIGLKWLRPKGLIRRVDQVDQSASESKARDEFVRQTPSVSSVRPREIYFRHSFSIS
jgi:hypothetical protein